MQQTVFLSLFLLLISGCITKNTSDSSVKVDVSEAGEFDITKEHELVKYIMLENTQGSIVSEISRIYVTDEHILIFDQQQQNIMLFTSSGDFIRNIGNKGNKGNARTEYNYLNDIDYDSQKQLIYAIDRIKDKMIIYDVTGNVVDVIMSRFAFNSFVKCDEGFWIYSCFDRNNPENYNVMLVDEQLQNIKQGHLKSKNFGSVTLYPNLYKDISNNIYFCYPLSAAIYKLGNTIETVYKPDYGNKNLPFDLLSNCDNESDRTAILCQDKYISYPRQVHILGNEMWFKCQESPLGVPVSSYLVTYNMANNTTNVYKNSKLPSNIPFTSFFSPIGITHKEELIYSVVIGYLRDTDKDYFKNQFNIEVDNNANYILAIYKKQ